MMRAGPATIAGSKKPSYAPWTAPGNVVSYELDRNLSTGGGLVASWADAGGRGKSLAGASGANTAGYTDNEGDGAAAVTFNGTAGLENNTWSGFDPDQEFTIGLVGKRTGTGDSIPICYGDHADGLGRFIFRIYAGATPIGGEAEMFSTTSQLGNAVLSSTAPDSAYHIWWVRRAGNTLYCSRDGIAEASGAVPTGAFNQAKFFMGFARATNAFVLPFTGSIRAMAVFQSNLGAPGATDREALRTYWKTKYPGLP